MSEAEISSTSEIFYFNAEISFDTQCALKLQNEMLFLPSKTR